MAGPVLGDGRVPHLRGLLTQIHPGLERVVGTKLEHAEVLNTLTRWPIPHPLHIAGRGHVRNRIAKHNLDWQPNSPKPSSKHWMLRSESASKDLMKGCALTNRCPLVWGE